MNLFSSYILENYDFLDLPNLQETDFTTNKDKKINIKAIPRSSSSIAQLDSNLPVLFQVIYTGHGWSQTTFLSSKVSLSLKETILTIDEPQFNAEYNDSHVCLTTNTLFSQDIIPIKNGNETLAYLINVSVRDKTYNELQDSLVTLDFGKSEAQNYGLKFSVPYYTVSLEERDHLLGTGEWNDEGWYGMPLA